MDEGEPAEAALQCSEEILVASIAFESRTLLALLLRSTVGVTRASNRRTRPHVPCMRFDGQKIQMDELCGLFLCVGFGIQPSAGSSCKRVAEIQQNGLGLRFGCFQCLLDTLAPVNRRLASLASPT
jgi:hypothetical protein